MQAQNRIDKILKIVSAVEENRFDAIYEGNLITHMWADLVSGGGGKELRNRGLLTKELAED